MAMHELPGVVGTSVDVVGTEKNRQKVMQFREEFLISLFPSLQFSDALGFKASTCNFSESAGISYV